MTLLKTNDRRLVLAAVFFSATLLAACGGGGGADSATAATAAPTDNAGAAATVADTYSQGTISGFGSIVVGGVRYDDNSASVSDEDGRASSKSALKLGMTVQVEAGAVSRSSAPGSTTASAVASRIRFGSEIVGPVGTVNGAGNSLQVLGQNVTVTSATVFDDSLVGGFSALTAGTVVEVHGIRDTTTGNTVATRIEAKTGVTAYRLRGTVASLNTTAKTFKIGSETVNYASAAPAPTSLADGQMVRVLLQTTQASGAWVATALSNGLRLPVGPVREAHIEGVITAYTSSTAFTVNGLLVDAGSASFPDGATGIVLGARVEVTGSVSNGKLLATKVEVEDRRDAGRREVELHGAIATINTTAKTFVLRGVTVWYGGTVTYKNIAESGLAVGKTVEVKGVLATDRTRLEARKIELESATGS